MPQPFIKWVGSKRKITDKLKAHMPDNYKDYWEPFLGGGSLFYALAPHENTPHISDSNPDMIAAYTAVRDAVEPLMRLLDEHQGKHCEDYYYTVRGDHEPSDDLARAARFIYLNKTAYNGIWRLNSKGLMNAPWNHKDEVPLYSRDVLLECSETLQSADIRCCSFDDIAPAAGDFVYLDPPYDDTYNGYSRNGFGEEGQRRLASFCRELDAQGVSFLLSNNGTELIRTLYDGFNFDTITAPRYISCKADGRKPVEEVLVSNYEWERK